jgi:transposase
MGGSMLTPQFDAQTFLSFLQFLKIHCPPDPLTVGVADNARYHRAKILEPFFQDNLHHLQLDFLPPYSPQLNPIERVWKLLRKLCTHNKYFANIDELVQSVTNQIKPWVKPNLILTNLCSII